MADQHQRAGIGRKFRLKPFNGGQVEMVGGLIQQQDIGLRAEYPGQSGAPCLAAGEGLRRFIAAQPQMFQKIARPVRVIAGAKTGADIIQRCGVIP